MGKGAKAVGKYIAGEFTGKNEYKRQKRQAKLNHKYNTHNNNHTTSTVVYAPPPPPQNPYNAYPQPGYGTQTGYTTVQTSYVQPVQTTTTQYPATAYMTTSQPSYGMPPAQPAYMTTSQPMPPSQPGYGMAPPPAMDMNFPQAGYPPGYGAPGMQTNFQALQNSQPVNSYPPPMGYPPGTGYPPQYM